LDLRRMNQPIAFDNSYARLPERFFARIHPTPVAAPRLIRVNEPLARQLGIDPDWLAGEEGVAMLAGNRLPAGAEPIATAYAGHQFGGFVPQLGDGRAMLLGEVIGNDGGRRDVQLKGSGPTPFSRRGDGRAALGPVLREYAVSEAMAALGIPTTRALAAVITGESVVRETMLPGGVITRVAASHIRIGTFQYFAARGDLEGLRVLADHVIARHYPAVAESAQPYRALLEAVIRAQATLIPRWLQVGFIHGVMNTDNMSIAGETIDYGPCAFVDAYDPATVYSAIDRQGRYAYANQPAIAQWNLTRLAECLLPLLGEDEAAAIAHAEAALDEFPRLFAAAHLDGFRKKLGLTAADPGDEALCRDLMKIMAAQHADFTLTFRRLSEASADAEKEADLRALFAEPASLDPWIARWRSRLAQEPGDPVARRTAMRAANPAVIPRNHQMEAVIRAAVDRDDFAPFHKFLPVLARPFEDQPDSAAYAQPPQAHEIVRQTFCGT
jgi:uncharacterized protein YdiU (UPF0061 family)